MNVSSVQCLAGAMTKSTIEPELIEVGGPGVMYYLVYFSRDFHADVRLVSVLFSGLAALLVSLWV